MKGLCDRNQNDREDCIATCGTLGWVGEPDPNGFGSNVAKWDESEKETKCNECALNICKKDPSEFIACYGNCGNTLSWVKGQAGSAPSPQPGAGQGTCKYDCQNINEFIA